MSLFGTMKEEAKEQPVAPFSEVSLQKNNIFSLKSATGKGTVHPEISVEANDESSQKSFAPAEEEGDYASLLHKLNNSNENDDNEAPADAKASRNVGRGLSENVLRHIHLSSIAALKTDRSQHINPAAETGVFGPKPLKDSRLNAVLQRLSEHNSQHVSHDSERHLVGTLENELADIITLFQSERAAQSQEINKLHQEIQRLNQVIEKQKRHQAKSGCAKCEKENAKTPLEPKRNTVQEAKIKGLEDLLHKMHKECFDSRNQILRIQEVVKEKDRKIEELQATLSENAKTAANERNYTKLQAEISYLKGLVEAKNKEASKNSVVESLTSLRFSKDSGFGSVEARKKLETSLKHAQDETKRLFDALKEKNSEIAGLKQKLESITTESTERLLGAGKVSSIESRNPVLSYAGGSTSRGTIDEKAYEGLISKVQSLENFMLQGQKEYHKKTQDYLNCVKDLEDEIKSQCSNPKENRGTMKLSNEIRELKNILLDMEQKYSFQAACSKSLQEVQKGGQLPTECTPHVQSFEATDNVNVSFSPLPCPRTQATSAVTKGTRAISPFSRTVLKGKEPEEVEEESENEKVESLTVNKFKKILESCCGSSRRERSVSTAKKRSNLPTDRKDLKTSERKTRAGNKSVRQNRSALRSSVRHDNIC